MWPLVAQRLRRIPLRARKHVYFAGDCTWARVELAHRDIIACSIQAARTEHDRLRFVARARSARHCRALRSVEDPFDRSQYLHRICGLPRTCSGEIVSLDVPAECSSDEDNGKPSRQHIGP